MSLLRRLRFTLRWRVRVRALCLLICGRWVVKVLLIFILAFVLRFLSTRGRYTSLRFLLTVQALIGMIILLLCCIYITFLIWCLLRRRRIIGASYRCGILSRRRRWRRLITLRRTVILRCGVVTLSVMVLYVMVQLLLMIQIACCSLSVLTRIAGLSL